MSDVLRYRILRMLRDRDISKQGVPTIEEVAAELGITPDDAGDQLDILDGMGAIKANRTPDGAASPMLYAVGRSMLARMSPNARHLQRQILTNLRDREREKQSPPSVAHLAAELSADPHDIDDQIHALSAARAVDPYRTGDGGATPVLTGRGRALLERLNQRAPQKRQAVTSAVTAVNVFEWDFFICHASEDKDSFVRLLAASLNDLKYRVWFDEFSLKVGDSLREKIDQGLARSRFGIVVLSPHFFAKKWPQDELDGLFSKETLGNKVILPVWLNIDVDGVRAYSPMLSGRRAAQASDGVDRVIGHLRVAIGDLGMESKLVTGYVGYKEGGDHDPSTNTIMCHRCLNWFANGQARCPECGWVVSEE